MVNKCLLGQADHHGTQNELMDRLCSPTTPARFSADISGDNSILGTEPLSNFYRKEKEEIAIKLSEVF